MPGPAPLYQPTFTAEQRAECERVVRQHSARQAHVARAKLALLLSADPALDNPTAGRLLGKHENWVRSWRRTWTREGFRLADKPGRGRKPVFSPSGGRHGQGTGLRTARSARGTTQSLQHGRDSTTDYGTRGRSSNELQYHLAHS